MAVDETGSIDFDAVQPEHCRKALKDKQMEKNNNKQEAVGDLLYSDDAYFCLECKSLLCFYEQGLCCDCGPHWETEIWDETKYPEKWVRVRVEARRI